MVDEKFTVRRVDEAHYFHNIGNMESTLAPCSPAADPLAASRMLDSAGVIAALAALAQEHRLYPLALDWLAAGRVKLEGGRVAYELEPERDYGPFLVPWAKRR